MISTAVRTRRAERAQHPTDTGATLKVAHVAVALLCAFGLLSGCGPRLEPDSGAGVSLAGSWRLNRQASADPNAMIAAIVEKEMKHMRRRARADDEDSDDLPPVESGRGGPGGGASGGRRQGNIEPPAPGGLYRPRGGMAAYLHSQYTNALGSVLNGEGLLIEQATDRFSLTRGDSHRSFTPGGHSVVGVTDGVADQTSGWKGREYVIDVRPQLGPHVTERYGIGAGGQLIEKISLSGDGLPKLEFTRVYDRGETPARVLPTSG